MARSMIYQGANLDGVGKGIADLPPVSKEVAAARGPGAFILHPSHSEPNATSAGASSLVPW